MPNEYSYHLSFSFPFPFHFLFQENSPFPPAPYSSPSLHFPKDFAIYTLVGITVYLLMKIKLLQSSARDIGR